MWRGNHGSKRAGIGVYFGVRIPEALISEIRARTDIVAVISQYVRLKRSGSNFVGLCPFHDEKTPSFHVSPSRGAFYCFGCHEKGDVITFLRKIEGKGFVEVVEELAAEAGIDLPREEISPARLAARRREKDERRKLLEVNEIAAEFFEQQLRSPQGAVARQYLSGRGVDDALWERFRIGYAPEAWDGLVEHLAKRKVSGYQAIQLGLVVPRGGRQAAAGGGVLAASQAYDFFRHRVMFPIVGPGGEVLGFSGRVLEGSDDPRKYVNSPESLVFRKSDSVFGIYQARKAIRNKGRAVVVEGNLDVVSMHQAGYEETVAPLGTALTEGQINRLRRFCDQVVVLFDGDDAGRKASLRAAELFLGSSLDGRIALLPRGQDPDTQVRSEPDVVAKAISAARGAPGFLLRRIAAAVDKGRIPDRARAVGRMAAVLTRIPEPVERSLYVEQAAALLDVEPATVLAALKKGVSARRSRGPSGEGERDVEFDAVVLHGLDLLNLLLTQPHLAAAEGVEAAVGRMDDESLRKAFESVLEQQRSTGRVDAAEVLALLDGPMAASVFEDKFSGDVDGHRVLHDILVGLDLAVTDRRLKNLEREIRRAKAEGDETRLRELVLRRHDLSKTRDRLIAGRS